MADNFTLSDLDTLTQLRTAAAEKRRVKWAVNGDLDVIAEGVARNFTDESGNFFSNDGDVRDAYFWISGMSEYFLPVRDLIPLIRDSLFVVQR